MTEQLSGPMTINYKKGDIICTTGQKDYDLFLIHHGKLLVFGNEGTRITPFAYLNSGEYLGELSFFDKQNRSANVICLEDSSLVKISVDEIEKQCPPWLLTLSKYLVFKLREVTALMGEKGIRKKNVETVKPLSIDEQREYYQKLEEHLANS